MPIPRERLRLTADELDALLRDTRDVHVATVSQDGRPHVAPMWFVWHEGALWVNSLRRSRRSSDLAAGSRAAVCVDTGETYAELRGAVFEGVFHPVASEDPDLPAVRRAFAEKYWGGRATGETGSHVWLRLAADRVVSWDFRKIPRGRDPRLEATRDA